jgi:hypothetical protein
LMANKVRLVYVAAWGRSGSTILGSILGALPGVFDAGELRHFWARMGREDHLCGCGATLASCEFWLAVHSELLADGELPEKDLVVVRNWQREAIRSRRISRIVRATSVTDLPRVPFGNYTAALRCLYRAISRVSGKSVVVDSSKKTGYGALARFALDESPILIHLVRDPRAVAYSWQRLRGAGPSADRQMPQHGAVASSLNWVFCNLGVDMLRRRGSFASMVIRYEDFVRAPRAAISPVLSELGRAASEASFVDDHTVDLPSNHAIAGNPSRFRHGLVTLSNDDEWIREQKHADRLACVAITLPFLRTYGYRLRVDRSP